MRHWPIGFAAIVAFLVGAVIANEYLAVLRVALGLPPGSTAVVRTGPRDGVPSVPAGDLDKQTLSDEAPLLLTSILGSQKVQYVVQLKREDIQRLALGVGRIALRPAGADKGFQCTGTLISEELVLTAGHCLTGGRFDCSRERPQLERATFWIGDHDLHDNHDGVEIRLDPQPVNDSWRHDCGEGRRRPLDYALFALKAGELTKARRKLPAINPLPMGDVNLGTHQSLLVLQHPKPGPETQPLIATTAGCRVTTESRDIWIRHECDTWTGSSGAPVLSEDHGVLVGVHNGTSGLITDTDLGDGTFNYGTRISAIVMDSDRLRSSGLLDFNPPTLDERLLLTRAHSSAAEADQRLNNGEISGAIDALLPSLKPLSNSASKENLFAHLTDFPSPFATLTEALTREPLRVVLTGVTRKFKEAKSLAFSPHDEWLAVGHDDGTVRIWDAKTGVLLRALGEEGTSRACKGILAVTFDTLGGRVVAACRNGIMQWDARSGSALCRWGPASTCIVETAGADFAAFSRDGLKAAVGYADGSVRVWDVERGTLRATFATGGSQISALAFSRDGMKVLAGVQTSGETYITQARLFDLARRTAPYEMLDGRRNQYIQAVALSCDGERFATAAEGGPMVVGRRGSDRRQTLQAYGREGRYRRADFNVPKLAFSPDGRMIVSGSRRGIATAWDTDASLMVSKLEARLEVQGSISSIAFDERNGPYECGGEPRPAYRVAIGYQDGTVRIFDVLTGEGDGVRRLPHGRDVQSLALSATGSMATGSDDSMVRVFDSGSGSVDTPQCPFPTRSVPYSVAFSADGKQLAIGTKVGWIFVIDPDCDGSGDRRVQASWEAHRDADVFALAFSTANRGLLAAGSRHGIVQLWKAPDYRKTWERQPSLERITSAAFSQDGNWLATSSFDRAARVWRLTSAGDAGDQTSIFRHDREVTSVAFSPDSKLLLTGSFDGNARIWDLTRSARDAYPVVLKGRPCRPEQMVEDQSASCPTWSVAFSPNMPYLVTASQDGAAWQWQTSSTSPTAAFPIFTFRGHTDQINKVAFGADGRTIVTASRDGYAIVWSAWQLSADETLAYAQISREGPLERTTKVATPPVAQSCPASLGDLLTNTVTGCEPSIYRALETDDRACEQGAAARCAQALRNYALATCYFERIGKAPEARRTRYRRASLARHLSKKVAASIWLVLSPTLKAAQCGD